MAIIPNPVSQGIAGFFAWWGGELAACVPGWLRGLFIRQRQQLVVEVSDNEAAFFAGKGKKLRPLGEASFSAADLAGHRDSGQREAVRRILRKARPRSSEVILRLPRDKVLRRQVELPAAAAENLREVLSFEMDKHTPFKANEIYFDFRIVHHDSDRKRIAVDLVVVPRALADQLVDLAGSWGLSANRIDVAGNDGASFDLLPRGTSSAGGSFGQRLSVFLFLVVLGLAAAAVYLPIHQNQEVLAAWEARLARVRAQAVEADELKARLVDLTLKSGYVVGRKQEERPAIEVLDAITRLLPDHTWVLKFNVSDNRLNLAGYSGKPSSLIALLEDSPMFKEVRFSSPVTMDRRVGLERFNLTATVTPRDTS